MTCGNHPENFLTGSRRNFLQQITGGFGLLALGSLLNESNAQEASLAIREPHFKPTAKRVCHIMMSGAQSHIDTWDPKPELQDNGGKTVEGGMRVGKLLASPFKFTPRGKSGIQVSEVWNQLGDMADDLAIVRSMWTDVPAHEEATVLQTTGDFRLPKPSLGSWVVYGLGSTNQSLPAFVAMNPGGYPSGGARNWQSAFMPGAFQGAFVDPTNTKIEQIIENIQNHTVDASDQRKQLDLLAKINEIHKQKRQADAQLEARIQSFELAYRMQTEATVAFDVSLEPQSVRDAYGETRYGRAYLIARRLLERGVRFVQVWQGGWDTHAGIATAIPRNTAQSDRAQAAFLKDLKQSGMLNDTLVVSTTEFGRGSREDGPGGRGHNAKAFSSWLAGGGIKGGTVYGATDELGSAAVENKVHVHELHATILHALGFDAQKLTYRSGGRDFRLIDVSGAQPVKQLFV